MPDRSNAAVPVGPADSTGIAAFFFEEYMLADKSMHAVSQPMKQEDIDPLWLLVIMGPIGSLAGCAALLRSGRALTYRAFWTAILNSGLMATAIAALMLWRFGAEEIWLTLGVSILAGLGGNAFVDFSLAALMRIADRGAKNKDE